MSQTESTLRDRAAPLVKIGPKHQMTIPRTVFEGLRLEVGDIVEVNVYEGKGIFTPVRLVAKAPAPKLSAREQRLLMSSKDKITAIQQNILDAEGLSEAEAGVAVKAGLIDDDQRYWWTENWQKYEREAQREIDEGAVSGPFDTAQELITHLHRQTV